MSHYIQYYENQIGGGGVGVRNVYSGSTYQRGRGIGSWLGGLIRKVLPYVTSGVRAVGKEAVRTGVNIMDDVTNNGLSFNEAMKLRGRESGRKLTKKAAKNLSKIMRGNGLKSSLGKRKRQSKGKRRPANNNLRKTRKKSVKKRKTKRRGGVGGKKKAKTTKSRSVTDIFGAV